MEPSENRWELIHMLLLDVLVVLIAWEVLFLAVFVLTGDQLLRAV